MDIGDEYLHSGDNKIKFEVKPDSHKTISINQEEDKVSFNYAARASQSNYLTTMGEYSQKVKYTITANDVDGNSVSENNTVEFPYTGSVQTFTAKSAGKYRVEVWGAAGAYDTTGGREGHGGYATGEINLSIGAKLYIAVGGAGDNDVNTGGGGWNGGGDADLIQTTVPDAGGAHQPGGGATSIYNVLIGDGQLVNYENDINSIVIAAGGGGGFYGGGAGYGAGGGSGYIGNLLLSNKHMFGYGIPSSDEAGTKTVSGACVSIKATADCAKRGNGYDRITYLGE